MGSFHVQKYAAGVERNRPARPASQFSDLTVVTVPPMVLEMAGGDGRRVEVRAHNEWIVHNSPNWRKR